MVYSCTLGCRDVEGLVCGNKVKDKEQREEEEASDEGRRASGGGD